MAAHTLGVELHVLTARTEHDFDSVFAALSELRVGALVIGPDPLFGSRTERLAALTLRHALPAIYLDRLFAMAGGLMSYAPALRMLGISRAATPAGYSKATSRRTCPCSNPQKSSW